MEELLKEINESLNVMQKGKKTKYWTREGYKEDYFKPDKGIGTKAYTIRRIDILRDKLLELKQNIKDGKYDYRS